MDLFVPDMYAQSVFTINYEKLKKSGIKCLLFDLDNTLCPVAIDKINKKTKDLFEELKEQGFKLVIISNSHKPRLAPFKEDLNVDVSASSKKPLKSKYQRILKTFGFKDYEVAAIGDQLLTDILGANRMNFTSILVNPISKNDLKVTKFNRIFERKIMKHLAKKGLFESGVYYD